MGRDEWQYVLDDIELPTIKLQGLYWLLSINNSFRHFPITHWSLQNWSLVIIRYH
jgi:hypothetical protein